MKGRSPISKLVWWIQSGFNFNFWFEFEYRIHRTIKGGAFWMNFWLLKCFTWDATLERNSPTKKSAQHKVSALGRMIRPNSAQWFGVSPDDPALGRMIRTWWLVSVQSSPGRMIRPCTGWSGPGNFSVCLVHSVNTPDDPGSTKKDTSVTFGGWEYIYPFTPFLQLSLSLPDQPRLQSTKSSTSLHPRAWFLQENT